MIAAIKKHVIHNKYDFLLFGLLQHLFVGILLQDLKLYTSFVWTINMFILALACSGIFLDKDRVRKLIMNIVFGLVVLIPILYSFFESNQMFLMAVSVSYTIFFSYLLVVVVRYILHTKDIKQEVLSAAACGFLLILEISVFLVLLMSLHKPESFNNLGGSNPTEIFTNAVYFCSIMLTTIGFGDITPASHSARLTISLIGWIGQFYSVFLVGSLVGKFSSK